MEKKFKFIKPIKVTGKPVQELTYDEEELTIELYNQACEKGNVRGAVLAREVNDKLHVAIFWACVMAVNQDIEFSTLNQVKGIQDITRMAEIGRDFILDSDASDQSISEEPSETTQELTIPALPTSESSESLNF